MRKLDRSDPEAMLPKELPDPVSFKSNRACVRNVLASQIDLSADLALFVPMSSLPVTVAAIGIRPRFMARAPSRASRPSRSTASGSAGSIASSRWASIPFPARTRRPPSRQSARGGASPRMARQKATESCGDAHGAGRGVRREVQSGVLRPAVEETVADAGLTD